MHYSLALCSMQVYYLTKMIYEMSLTESIGFLLVFYAIFGSVWVCVAALFDYLRHRQDDAEFRNYCRNYVEREHAHIDSQIEAMVRAELEDMRRSMEVSR